MLHNAMNLIVSHVARRCRELGVALDDFVDGFEEVLLGGDLATSSDGKHASFGADGSDFGTSGVGTQTSEQLESNVALNAHGARVDLEDVRAAFQIGQPKLHFTIETSGTHECWIQSVGSIGGHQHFDVSTWIEAIELIDEFQHRSLHFVVTASAIIKTSTTDCVNFVEEDQAGLLATCHLEELSNHASAFTDILLHQL